MTSQDSFNGIFPREMAIYGTGKNVSITNTTVHDNNGHGLMVLAKKDTISKDMKAFISDCLSYNNGSFSCEPSSTAIGIGSYSDSMGQAVINNCIAYNNGASGIAPHGVMEVTISNCISYNNREHGIVIQQSDKAVVVGNLSYDNGSFACRVQGDFSKPENEQFVNNVLVSSNCFIGNGIKVGVHAKNILVKNNKIKIVSPQNPFYFDNILNTYRNKNTENIVFTDNYIDGVWDYAEPYSDYFNNLKIFNNKDSAGNLLGDGWNIFNGENALIKLNTSNDCINITPYNNISSDIKTYSVDSYTNNTFTITTPRNANTFILYKTYDISSVMSFFVKCPEYVIPYIRLRDSDNTLLSTVMFVRYDEEIGNIPFYSGSVIPHKNNLKMEIGFVTVQSIPNGTYDFDIQASIGYKIKYN